MTDETFGGALPEPFADAVQASVAQDAAREDRSKPYEDSFFVPLTQEDRNALLVESAELLATIAGAEADKREAAKAAQEAIDAKYDRLHEIGRRVQLGTVEKTLTVVDVRVFATNEMRIERVDTGEVVFKRALTADERQGDLFGEEATHRENGATAAAQQGDVDSSSTAPPNGAEPVDQDTAGSEVMADTSASAGEESTTPESATPDAFGGVHDPNEVDRGDPTPAAVTLDVAAGERLRADTKKRKRSKKNGA